MSEKVGGPHRPVLEVERHDEVAPSHVKPLQEAPQLKPPPGPEIAARDLASTRLSGRERLSVSEMQASQREHDISEELGSVASVSDLGHVDDLEEFFDADERPRSSLQKMLDPDKFTGTAYADFHSKQTELNKQVNEQALELNGQRQSVDRRVGEIDTTELTLKAEIQRLEGEKGNVGWDVLGSKTKVLNDQIAQLQSKIDDNRALKKELQATFARGEKWSGVQTLLLQSEMTNASLSRAQSVSRHLESEIASLTGNTTPAAVERLGELKKQLVEVTGFIESQTVARDQLAKSLKEATATYQSDVDRSDTKSKLQTYWGKRQKTIDKSKIDSWSAELDKLAKSVPDFKRAMEDRDFSAQYTTLKAKIADGTYKNLDEALKSGLFGKVKALVDQPVYIDYIRRYALWGHGALTGSAAPVSPDVSVEHPDGPWVRDEHNFAGGGWVRQGQLDRAKQQVDIQLAKDDSRTSGLLEATKNTSDRATAIATRLNSGEIGDLRSVKIDPVDAPLVRALGGDERSVKQAKLLERQREELGGHIGALRQQDRAIDARLEELNGNFDVLNEERNAAMKGVGKDPNAHLRDLAGSVATALKPNNRAASLSFEPLLANKDAMSPSSQRALGEVALYHAQLGDGTKLISPNPTEALAKEKDLTQYAANLRTLIAEPTIDGTTKAKLTKELAAVTTALEPLKKYNHLSAIFGKEEATRRSIQRLKSEKTAIANKTKELQRASNLAERMEGIVTAKSLIERTRTLVGEQNKIKTIQNRLAEIRGDKDVTDEDPVSWTTAEGRAAAKLELDRRAQGLSDQLKSVNALYNDQMARIKRIDADPTKELPDDSWGRFLWDKIRTGTGIPVGDRLGREDVGDLTRDKLMADKGITLSGSYQALAEKLKGASTVRGAEELIRSLSGLPGWAYNNPDVAKELSGDIAHAIAILKAGPEAQGYMGTLDNIATRLRTEGLASDLLVGNRTEYGDRDIPAEVFALIHMAKMAPYAARVAKSGETTLGSMLRGVGGDGLVGSLLAKLGNLGQNIVTTSVERNVAKAMPRGSDALITAAQQLYRGENLQDVAKRYAAREAVKEVAGHAREIYEEGWTSWLKNVVSFKQLRDTWNNAGVGEKIYRVITEGALPVAGAVAAGFLLGGPIGIAVALAIALGGTFMAGRFNDRVTPWTQDKVRKQRMAEKAQKYLLSNDQYAQHLKNAAKNTGLQGDALHAQTGQYLAEKLSAIAKNHGGSLEGIPPKQLQEELDAAIQLDNNTDVARRAKEYGQQKRASGGVLRDTEVEEMQRVLSDVDSTLFASRDPLSDGSNPADSARMTQPVWSSKTGNIVRGVSQQRVST